VREELASPERAAKAIQDKLDRLDEAFLFERSIDIETYDAIRRNSARSSRSEIGWNRRNCIGLQLLAGNQNGK
jgi:hypothetical protein